MTLSKLFCLLKVSFLTSPGYQTILLKSKKKVLMNEINLKMPDTDRENCAFCVSGVLC